jgi:threonine dehydrogenase-like Zn-dependent dehydrogenase
LPVPAGHGAQTQHLLSGARPQRDAIDAGSKVDRKSLITHRYALAEAAQAFEAQIDTAETLKVIIQP